MPLSSVIPKSWIDQQQWIELKASAFKQHEHIDVYELKAVLQLYEHLCQKSVCHQSRFVTLCDNSADVAVLSRGRSKVPRLNNLARRRFAAEVISEIRLHAALVGTNYQPLDKALRRIFSKTS